MPPKKGRRKTNVLEQVSKEIKTAIVNAEDKYGSPTNLKVTELPTIKGRTQSGSTQSFVIVDPDTQCIPYFVCKKCAVVMGPITCHRKCFLNGCEGDDQKKIKKRYRRAVQRLTKIKEKEVPGKSNGDAIDKPAKKACGSKTNTNDIKNDKDDTSGGHATRKRKGEKPSKGDRVSIQFDNDNWYTGTVDKVNRKTFYVNFDDGSREKIDIEPKQDEDWKFIL